MFQVQNALISLIVKRLNKNFPGSCKNKEEGTIFKKQNFSELVSIFANYALF